MRQFATALAIAILGSQPAFAETVVVDPDAKFPEGPLVVDGALHHAEYGGHVVSRIDLATGAKSELWRLDGCGPSAVVPLGADRLLVTCYDNGTLVAISPAGETLQTWREDDFGEPLVGPNDATPDRAGGAWATASGPWSSPLIVGKVYRLAAEGSLRMVADDLHYANGVALAPDGARLFVVELEAGRVISFAVRPDGTLDDRRLFARLAALDPGSGIGAYPDGMEFGPDGVLYVGQYSSGRILAIAGDGSLVRVLEVPSLAAPNLTFAPDGDRIFVTAVDDTANPPYVGKVYALPAR